ncbi:helix-turn-helix transcriptional regulator [Paractinoplanes maris]|uniref:helix-turn-helix transcriptional regulator n=1 Tax=Paractinoplanes maris TaxID=1734446 RepID=UPI0020202DDD|nr:WYL domain-containing protein [Actinoplanes maris]
MLTTSARVLRLLSRLQVPGRHPGPALAEQLGVSPRTVRADIATLRELGYPVTAVPGAAGGYRLATGNRLPPLVLDDDEAAAVVVGLTSSATHAVAGTADASMRALTKVVAMLPARLRPRLASLSAVTSGVSTGRTTVEIDVLHGIAAATQAREQIRFLYTNATGEQAHREVEPHRIVLRAGRWYLVGWDPAKAGWRTFRVDRMRVKTPNGRRFAERAGPADGFEEYLTRSIQTASWQQLYRVRLHAPAETIRRRAPLAVRVEPDGDQACVVTVGSDSAASVARYLSWWEVPFEVLDSPELRSEVALLAERYTSAAGDGRR